MNDDPLTRPAHSVILETYADDKWITVTFAPEELPPGSISADETDGRQVYVFGWLADPILPGDEGPGVWRSKAGVDIEQGFARKIITSELERIADLTENPFEMILRRHVVSDDFEHRIRFRLA